MSDTWMKGPTRNAAAALDMLGRAQTAEADLRFTLRTGKVLIGCVTDIYTVVYGADVYVADSVGHSDLCFVDALEDSNHPYDVIFVDWIEGGAVVESNDPTRVLAPAGRWIMADVPTASLAAAVPTDSPAAPWTPPPAHRGRLWAALLNAKTDPNLLNYVKGEPNRVG